VIFRTDAEHLALSIERHWFRADRGAVNQGLKGQNSVAMRFSLLTLVLIVLLAGSIMAFVMGMPAWRLSRTMNFDRPIKTIYLADGGRKIVAVQDKIHIYDRDSGTQLLELKIENEPDEYFTATAISKQRDAIAFYDNDGCVSIYSTRTLKRVMQTPPVNGLSKNSYRIGFSESGMWVTVPIQENEYNAYSLSGEKKVPLLSGVVPFRVNKYFDSAEIVFRSADDKNRAHSTEEFYSLKRKRPVFEYGLPQSGWVYWAGAISPDGAALFGADANGRVARLDLKKEDQGPILEKDFIFPTEKKRIGDSVAYFSDDSILAVWMPKTLASQYSPYCPCTLYSTLDLKPFANFTTYTRDSFVMKFVVDNERRRMFASLFSKTKDDFDRVQVIDVDSGEVLFAHRNRNASIDFDANANCVLVYDRQTCKVFVRDHPEWWWGHFYRIETWLIVLFSALLVRQLILSRRKKKSA